MVDRELACIAVSYKSSIAKPFQIIALPGIITLALENGEWNRKMIILVIRLTGRQAKNLTYQACELSVYRTRNKKPFFFTFFWSRKATCQ